MDHSFAPPYHHSLSVSMQNQHSHFAHPDPAVLPTYHHHYDYPTATSLPQRTRRNDQRPLPFQLVLPPGSLGYANVSTAHPPPTLVETRSGEFITACINNCPICHEETQKTGLAPTGPSISLDEAMTIQPGENLNKGGKTRSAHCRLHGPASLRYLERILGPDHPTIKHELQSYREAPVFFTPTQVQASHQSSSALRTRRTAPFKAVARREKKANVTMSFKRMLPPNHVTKPGFVPPRFQRTTSRLAHPAPAPVFAKPTSLESAHGYPEHATSQGYEPSHDEICAFFDGKTHEDLLQMLDDFSPDKHNPASLQPATFTTFDPNFAVPSSPQDRLHAYETMFSSPSSTLSFDSPWSASNSSASSSPVTPLFPAIDLEPSVQIQDLSYPAEWSFITRDVRSLDEVAAARLVSTAGVKKSYQSGSASILSAGALKKPHASVSTGTLRATGLKLPGIGQPCIRSKA